MTPGKFIKVLNRKTHFHTPWFDLISKEVDTEGKTKKKEEYYSIQTNDYVCVLAITPVKELILVRQFRPAVEQYTLEFPAGNVEKDESPSDAAKRELLEETGYTSETIELLGCLNPDTGRLSNKQWCFGAWDVKKKQDPTEENIQVHIISLTDFKEQILKGGFTHALHIAALNLAMLKNRIIF